MSTPKVPRVKVALKLYKLNPPQKMAAGKSYVDHMTGNKHFPAPSPSLADITNQIAVLDQAFTQSLTRVRGAVGKMHVEEKILTSLINGLGGYVETCANADPENAVSIIEKEAGMTVKDKPIRKPKNFTAVNGAVNGTVELDTKAVKRSSYIYQISTDPNNPLSWVTLATCQKVRYLATGLTSGVRYYFRVAVVTGNVTGNFSPPISVLVH